MIGTPAVIDTFSRYFQGVFDDTEKIKASTGFQAFFSRGDTIFENNADSFDNEVIRGNKKIAALVPRAGTITRHLGSNIKTLKAGLVSKFNRVFPLGLEYFSVDADLLNKVIPGEGPYQRFSEQTRLRYYTGKGYREMIRRFVDMFELLAAQSMIEGIQDAIIDTTDTNNQYNWQRLAANTITVGTVWTNPAADVIGDINDACIQVEREGRAKPDILCMSPSDYNSFRQNTEIQTVADNMRFEDIVKLRSRGGIPPTHTFLTDNGWVARGKIITDGGYEVYIYTYTGYYENASDTPVDYMTAGKAIVTSSEAQFDRLFGPPKALSLTPAQRDWYIFRFGIDPMTPSLPENVPTTGVILPQMFHLRGKETENAIETTMQTAPIFKTTQTDAVATLIGLQ